MCSERRQVNKSTLTPLFTGLIYMYTYMVGRWIHLFNESGHLHMIWFDFSWTWEIFTSRVMYTVPYSLSSPSVGDICPVWGLNFSRNLWMRSKNWLHGIASSNLSWQLGEEGYIVVWVTRGLTGIRLGEWLQWHPLYDPLLTTQCGICLQAKERLQITGDHRLVNFRHLGWKKTRNIEKIIE